MGRQQVKRIVKRFSRSDVRVLDQQLSFKGFMQLLSVKLTHALFQGGQSQVMNREVLMRTPAVAVLPYDPVRDEVVLVEQFRIGAYMADDAPWILEVPAGIVDPGESVQECIARELLEETGLVAGPLHFISEYFPSPGGTNEKIHLYCAEVDASDLREFHGVDGENEDIRTLRLSREEFSELKAAGRLNNAATLLGFYWLNEFTRTHIL